MPTGSLGPFGISDQQIGGLANPMAVGNHMLTNELSLTSYAPTFNGNQFISPLTGLANFGKKKTSLKTLKKDIRYLRSLKN